MSRGKRGRGSASAKAKGVRGAAREDRVPAREILDDGHDASEPLPDYAPLIKALEEGFAARADPRERARAAAQASELGFAPFTCRMFGSGN